VTRKAAAAAAVALAVIALWSVTLGAGFVYDDHKYILGNPWVKDAAFLADIFSSSTSAFSPGDATSNTYRPFLFTLYLAEYLVFGPDPFYFHLVNVLAHGVNAALVFLLAMALFENEGRGGGLLPAVFAATAFGFHTVNSEVVNWVSASTELFFTLFVLAGLNVYVRCRSGLSSAPFFFGALLFKETAAAFPAVAFAVDFFRREPLRTRWKAYLLFAAVAAVYSLMRFNALGGVMHHKQIALTAFETVINIFPLVAAYFSKLVFPAGLSVIYDFHPARSVLDIRVLAGALVVLFFCLAVFFARKRPPVVIGLAMMAVPLLPVLYVPALSSSAMADRYLYLPSAGAAIALASVMPAPGNRAYRAAFVFSCALLVAWAAGSVSRSRVWKSDLTLWADAVIKASYSPNAHYNYAWASHNAGRLDDAVRHYHRSAELAPSADAHYNVGLIFMGQMMIDEAEAEFTAALALDPSFDRARGKLAEIRRLREAGR